MNEWEALAAEHIGINCSEVKQILKQYVQELPAQLRSFSNKDPSNTFKERKRNAHSMKSSSLMLGMNDVAKLAEQFEQTFSDLSMQESIELSEADYEKNIDVSLRVLCTKISAWNILLDSNGFDALKWLEEKESE